MSAWPDYRGVLASKLEGTEFAAVAESVPVLAQFSDDMQANPAWDTGAFTFELLDKTVERIQGIRGSAAIAYNALAPLAGHDRVGDRIYP